MLDLELLFHCGYINNCYYTIVIITPKTQNLLHGWTSVNAYKPVNNWDLVWKQINHNWGLVWKQINHKLYWFNSKTSWHTAIIQFLIKYNNNSRSLFSISIIIKNRTCNLYSQPQWREAKFSPLMRLKQKGSLIRICTCSLRGKRLGFLRPIYVLMSLYLSFIFHGIYFLFNTLDPN